MNRGSETAVVERSRNLVETRFLGLSRGIQKNPIFLKKIEPLVAERRKRRKKRAKE